MRRPPTMRSSHGKLEIYAFCKTRKLSKKKSPGQPPNLMHQNLSSADEMAKLSNNDRFRAIQIGLLLQFCYIYLICYLDNPQIKLM